MRRLERFLSELVDLPLRIKLQRILLLCLAAALALNFAVYSLGGLYNERERLIDQLDATARIIGANSASALAFSDTDSAAATLAEALMRVTLDAGRNSDMSPPGMWNSGRADSRISCFETRYSRGSLDKT